MINWKKGVHVGVFWATTKDLDYFDMTASRIVCDYNISSDDFAFVNKYSTIETLPNIYDNIEKFDDAYDYCVGISNDLIEYYTSTLNEINRCSYNANEWRYIVYYWVFCFVSNLFDKYLKVRQMESIYEDFYSIADDFYDISTDTLSFLETMQTDSQFNLALLAETFLYFNHRILNRDKQPIERIKWNEAGDGECLHIPVDSCLRKTVFSCFKRIFHFRKCTTYVTTGEYLPGARLVDFISFGAVREDNKSVYIITGTCRIDKANRERLCINPNTKDEFYNFVASIIGKYIPQSLLEFFQDIGEIAKKSYPYSARRIIDGIHFAYDEAFKRFIADTKAAGGELHLVAHGGYGILRNYYEVLFADRFYTWGFKDKRCNCIVMPAGKLIGLKKAHPKSGKGIYFVDYYPVRYVFRHIEGFERDLKLFLNTSTEFLSRLSDSVAKKTLIRLGHEDKDGVFLEKIKQLGKTFVFQDPHENCIYSEMAKSSLIVTTALKTVWMEALHMGVPVIVVLPQELISCMKEAEQYIDMLEDVDILVHDPLKAAAIVNEIEGNEIEWWNEPKRREVVRIVRNRFAYSTKFGRLIWLKELLDASGKNE